MEKPSPRRLGGLILLLVGSAFTGAASGNTYYIATGGKDTNNGAIGSPLASFSKAISLAAPGDTLYVRGGTYAVNDVIRITKSGSAASPISLLAYPGEAPILDFATNTSTAERGIQLDSDYWRIKGLTLQHAPDNGLFASGSNNVLEQLTLRWNKDSGLQLSGSSTVHPSNNLILNCDSYENYDPANHGENADGFAAKFADLGSGNVFRGSRSWGNSDDGWDLWQAGKGVRIERCWSYGNGVNIWNDGSFAGDGNGFKLGQFSGAHVLVDDVAWNNVANGVDVNGNGTGVTVENTSSYHNGGVNWRFDENLASHVLRNNLSLAGAHADVIYALVDDAFNTWNGIPIDSADFLSLSDAIARGARLPNGSLPITAFLRLAYGSNLIDAGTNVGLAYTGAAPDLGAFENGIPNPGDANLDGKVDVTDLGILATNWQKTGRWIEGDFNFDGKIDVTDLGLLATNWQSTGPNPLLSDALAQLGLGVASIPEPATIASVGLLACAAALRARSQR